MNNSYTPLSKRSYNQQIFSRDLADSVSDVIFNGGKIVLNKTSEKLDDMSNDELLKTVSLIIRNNDNIEQALNEFFQEVVHLMLEGGGEYGLFLLNGIQEGLRSYRLVQKKYWNMVEGILIEKFKFKIPKSLGGNRGIKKIYMNLSDDNPQYLDFIMDGIPIEGLKNHSYIYISKVTSIFGWNQHDEHQYFTTFYSTYRRIKFVELVTVLRESLLSQLNTILACKELSMKVELKLEGVLKSEDFHDIYEQLSKPKICDFEDIFNLMLNKV